MNRSYIKGQELARILPALSLVGEARPLVEAFLTDLGRLTLETLLSMSAVEVAGEPRSGREKGPVRYHGSQAGLVDVGGKRDSSRQPSSSEQGRP